MKKIKILPTIDVEGHKGNNPIEKLVFGKTPDGYFGITKIMDEFDRVNAKGLFFVDFAECWDYGEDNVKKVVDAIIQRGHNIGVHIHPDHMLDKNRLFLYEYSYEEQYTMVKKCTSMYQKLVGKQPLSFRAGKYSANRETLEILNELGYKYDFSEFYHQKWCGIEPPITVNTPVKYKGLVEFPVTMHQSVKMGPLVREDKLDMEDMTTSELKYALSQIKNQNFEIIATLFFHSFSLLNWKESPDMPYKNERKLIQLKNAIKYIYTDSNFCFISEAELQQIRPLDSTDGLKSEIKWKSNILGLFYTYIKAKKIYKNNKKAKFLVYIVRSSGIGIILCILFLLCIIWRR